jgi:hypothetical protein
MEERAMGAMFAQGMAGFPEGVQRDDLENA